MNGSWDLFSTWYPDGMFALLEVAAYVGLPVLGLAVAGARLRRSRPLVIAIVVLVAIPVVEAFQPEGLLSVPLLNGLRSPVRAYLPASLLLGVVAGLALGRRVEMGLRVRLVVLGVAVPVIAYAATLLTAMLAPDAFNAIALAFTTFGNAEEVAQKHDLVLAAMQAPWPLVAELASGAAIILVAIAAGRSPGLRRVAAPLAVIVVAVPLLLFGPAPNDSRGMDAFTSADSPFIRAGHDAGPYRMLTIDPPGWYAGFPDQPAAAGLADLRMFSSLNLRATDAVTLEAARATPEAAALRRVLGVDTAVTFDAPCPGIPTASSPDEKATFCRDEAALRPPYWIPLAAATAGDAASGPLKPREAAMDLAAVAASAVPLDVLTRGAGSLWATFTAPGDGWVWIDRAWWPGWTTTVDGDPVEALQALGGQLVLVTAGHHEISQALVPWDALAGLAVGVLALVVAVAWAWRGRRRPSLI